MIERSEEEGEPTEVHDDDNNMREERRGERSGNSQQADAGL